MKATTRIGAWATVLALGAGLLAGCSPAASETPVTDTLRVNWGGVPASWAPGASTETGYMRVPYETLVVLAPDYSVQPNLVTSWEQEPMAITMHLRDDVTFHDGTPFDAEAVKVNLEYVRDTPGQFSGPLQAVASVDVVDAHTAKVNLKFPAPTFMSMLTQRNVFIASPKAIADGSVITHPVGTGPWAYSEADSQQDVKWTFHRTDDYWGEPVGFETIELYGILDDTAATAALLGGEIDMTDTVPDQEPLLAADDRIQTVNFDAGRNNIVFFDRAPGGAFGDVNVRKALCTAIDTQSMLDLEGIELNEASTQHFLEGDVGYNPDIVGYVKGDLAKAKTLLGGATVSGAFPSAIFLKSQLEYLADQMNQLDGVNITVQDLPAPQFISGWASGQYPLGVGQNNQITPYDWYSTWFAASGFYNPSKYESPELKAAAAAAIAAGDTDQADALWQKVMKIIIDDEALACSFAVFGQTVAYNSDVVTGVAAPPEPYEVNLINYRDLVPATK